MSAYRERPQMLLCPRCGDVLEQGIEGTRGCSRCGGVWVALPLVVKAFGTGRWPHGSTAWWRRELPCPVCSFEGAGTSMSKVTVGEVEVDRCVEHGLWLDHGELGRLMGAPSSVELDALRARIRGEPLAEDVWERGLAAERERAAELVRKAEESAKAAAETRARQRAAAEKRDKRAALAEEMEAIGDEVQAREAELVSLRADLKKKEAEVAHARERLLEVTRKLKEVDG